nr:hypothetical protein [Tanacetum cinerariifolium]
FLSVDFSELRNEVVTLKNQQSDSAHVISKLKANLERARSGQNSREDKLVCDLTVYNERLLKDIAGLQDLFRITKTTRKIIEDDS